MSEYLSTQRCAAAIPAAAAASGRQQAVMIQGLFDDVNTNGAGGAEETSGFWSVAL